MNTKITSNCITTEKMKARDTGSIPRSIIVVIYLQLLKAENERPGQYSQH